MIDKKNFKNSSGAYITKSLFMEFELAEKVHSVYTLKDQDHTLSGKTYPSLRRLFVESEDLTEYSFAVTHLAGWPHWKKITEQEWFKPYLAEWREELLIRVKSHALKRVKQKAEEKGKDALVADKILLTWQTPEKVEKVGRPTKEKIRFEADKLFKQESEIDADFERILGGLN